MADPENNKIGSKIFFILLVMCSSNYSLKYTLKEQAVIPEEYNLQG
jgi:hypothetical protein